MGVPIRNDAVRGREEWMDKVRVDAELLQPAIPRGRTGDEQVLLGNGRGTDTVGAPVPRPARSPTSQERQHRSLVRQARVARSRHRNHLPSRGACREERLEDGLRSFGVAQSQRRQQSHLWIQQRREAG